MNVLLALWTIAVIAWVGLGTSMATEENEEWVRTLGGADYDYPSAVVTLTDGSIAVTGWTRSPTLAGIHIGKTGWSNAFVAKLSPFNGSVEWAVAVGGERWGQSMDAVALSHGSVAIAGHTRSSTIAGVNVGNAGADDVFVAKLSGVDGSVEWIQTIAGASSEWCHAAAGLSDGSLAVTGSTWSRSLSGVNIDRNNYSESVPFVAKLSATDGSVAWIIIISTDRYAYASARDVLDVGDGGLFVVGYTTSTTLGGFLVSNAGLTDGFVAKLSAVDGSILWVKTVGGENSDWPQSAIALSSGSVALFTTSDSATMAGFDIGNFSTHYRTIITWISVEDGTVTQAKAVSNDTSWAVNPAFLCSSLIAVSGTSNWPVLAGFDIGNAGDSDSVVATLSAVDGSVQWIESVGGSHRDLSLATTVLADGSVVVVGSTLGLVDMLRWSDVFVYRRVPPSECAPQPSCAHCQPGKHCTIDASNSSTCVPCAAGKFSRTAGATNSSTCVPCAAGKFSRTAGATSCLRCARGFLSAVGATGCSIEGCPTGMYARGSGCDSCPPRMICKDGVAVSCPRCTGYSNSSNGPVELVCAANFGGDDCNECPAGHYATASKCVECSASYAVPIGVIVVMATMFFVLRLTSDGDIGDDDKRHMQALHAVTHFAQLLSFVVIASITWPDRFRAAMSWFAAMGMDFGLSSIDCLLGRVSQYDRFVVSLVMPLVVLSILLIAVRIRSNNHSQSSRALLHLAVLTTTLSYASVVSYALSLFVCDDGYLRSDPSVQCDVDELTCARALAAVVLVFVGAGLPVVNFHVHQKASLKRDSGPEGSSATNVDTSLAIVLRDVATLYDDQQPWFDSVIMVRKLLTLVALQLLPDATSQSGAALAIAVGYLAGVLMFQPFARDSGVNTIERVGSAALATSFGLSLLVASGGLDVEAASAGMLWMAAALALYMVGGLVYWWCTSRLAEAMPMELNDIEDVRGERPSPGGCDTAAQNIASHAKLGFNSTSMFANERYDVLHDEQ